MPQSFDIWWSEQGPLTRAICIGSTGMTLLSSFGIVPLGYFTFDRRLIVNKLQLWRPLSSAFLLGRLDMAFIINLFTLVVYVGRIEKDLENRPADLAWMIACIVIGINIIGGYIFELPILTFSFMMSLIWIYCKRNCALNLSIYMFQFKAGVFPWVMILFHMAMGIPWIYDLVGILVGHLYLFLVDILPRTHQVQILKTPSFMVRYFKQGAFNANKHMTANATNPTPGTFRVFRPWGTGRRLNE